MEFLIMEDILFNISPQTGNQDRFQKVSQETNWIFFFVE